MHGDLCIVIIWAQIKTVLVFRKNVFCLQYCCFQIRKIEHYGVGGLYSFCEHEYCLVIDRFLPKVGGLQISFANRQSANLLPRKICYICEPSANMAIRGFAIC